MSSGDRFYQLDLRNRPALHGDVGSLLKIEGLVVGGEGKAIIMLLPHASQVDRPVVTLTDEQWADWIQRSDQPEILIGPAKVFHRKVRYEISGLVQQRVWVADGFKCVYCEKAMGDVQLTVDHFVPLELGGVNNTSNYLSACRRCNKNKGSADPKEWCKPQQFLELQHYLKHRKV